MKTFPILLLAWFTFAVSAFADEAKAPKSGPWKVAEWKNAPVMRWVDQAGPVHSLFYTSENYKGHATEVFAFYSSPATLGKGGSREKIPSRRAHSRRRRDGIRGMGVALGAPRPPR